MPTSTVPETPYEHMGAETAVSALVNRFYDLMDTLPEAWDIRKLHPQDLSGSREKLFKFLSGWLGGPPLYQQEFGHPMLRRRHLPFPIDSGARDQWMLCMNQALDEQPMDPEIREGVRKAFASLADHMRNQLDTPEIRGGPH
ncbi:MAG: group II truncated hemoglobin [Thioalkalivibrio sp.]|nr:group II truncated hemoglobin [Thioalkalivibrio sp.]